MKKRVDHIALVVTDTKAAACWYAEKFSGSVEYSDHSWSLVSFENIKIAFVLSEGHPPHKA